MTAARTKLEKTEQEGTPRKSSVPLTWIMLGAIVGALVLAITLPEIAQSLSIGGKIFMRLLNMLVVPLVITSVMHGILNLGDVRRLGRPGLATLAYFLGTTMLAVVTGIVLVNLIQPGTGAFDVAQIESAMQAGSTRTEDAIEKQGSLIGKDHEVSYSAILESLALSLFTDNLVGSAARMELLPLIVFSIAFAGLMTTMESKVSNVKILVSQLNDAILTFVLWVMKIAPLGIFCLVAGKLGEAQLKGNLAESLQYTASYMAVVLLGLFIHAAVNLPSIYWVLLGKNPLTLLKHSAQAILTAFSTASSSATIPVTMECAIDKARIPRRSADLVIPLGATVNMNGTALYEAVACLFVAQVLGKDLSLAQQVTVAFAATLAAIGAAGIPEAGLITLLVVLQTVGLKPESIGLILAVDWILDRFRTAVNVLGDIYGAAIVAPYFTPGNPRR